MRNSLALTRTPKSRARVSVGIARYLCVSALCVTSLSLFAQTKSDPEYKEGVAAWQVARYPSASEHLSRYRVSVPYGKLYDVDYLLGTSWCRMEGMAKQGASLLSWALQRDMPESAAKLFRAEWQACSGAAALRKPEQLAQVNAGAGAIARASGKMFYSIDAEGNAFAAYPLELVKPLPEAEYAKRIFPLGAGEAAVAATKERLGSNYRVIAVGRFVLASRTHSEADLHSIAGKLTDYVAFLEREYGIVFPPYLVTVQLASSSADLVDIAMRVHGLRASQMNLGYTFQNDLSVTAVMTTTASGSLFHEMFHLGVRANFGDVPSWLDESLASLYETSVERGGAYRGVPNWRGQVILRMGGGRDFHLKDLVAYLSSDRVNAERSAAPEFRSDESARMAALGRYFAFYLQEKGKLRAVYTAFRDKPAWVIDMPAQEASIRLVEQATGTTVGAMEHDFIAWLGSVIGAAPAPVPQEGTPMPKKIPDMLRQSPGDSREQSAPRQPTRGVSETAQ
jgi:hypothetical protein